MFELKTISIPIGKKIGRGILVEVQATYSYKKKSKGLLEVIFERLNDSIEISVSGDTYGIKEILKKDGFRFDNPYWIKKGSSILFPEVEKVSEKTKEEIEKKGDYDEHKIILQVLPNYVRKIFGI